MDMFAYFLLLSSSLPACFLCFLGMIFASSDPKFAFLYDNRREILRVLEWYGAAPAVLAALVSGLLALNRGRASIFGIAVCMALFNLILMGVIEELRIPPHAK